MAPLAPFFESGADVHRGDVSLTSFSFMLRTGTRLSKEERLVARQVLETGEIRAELGLAVQVEVERVEIEK